MSKGVYNKFQEFAKEHSIICCAIANKNEIHLGFQFDGDAEGSIACSYFPMTKRKWGGARRNGFYRSNCCILPEEKKFLLFVGWQGAVLAQSGYKDTGLPLMELEKPISILPNCPIENIRVIDGQAYIAAGWRTVFRRDGIDRWTCLHGNDPKEVEQLQKKRTHTGFSDIGGFSKNEIYACGHNGDLWLFNGDKWRALSAPTNKKLVAMCCTPNGKVYIGCNDGTLIEGRRDSWEVLEHKAPKDLNDMIWYKDKLYISCGAYGLHVFDGSAIIPALGISSFGSMFGAKEGISPGSKAALKAQGMSEDQANLFEALSTVEVSDDILAPASMHSLATDGEILLVAGVNRVVAFNGEEWKMLYSHLPSKQGGELW